MAHPSFYFIWGYLSVQPLIWLTHPHPRTRPSRISRGLLRSRISLRAGGRSQLSSLWEAVPEASPQVNSPSPWERLEHLTKQMLFYELFL